MMLTSLLALDTGIEVGNVKGNETHVSGTGTGSSTGSFAQRGSAGLPGPPPDAAAAAGAGVLQPQPQQLPWNGGGPQSLAGQPPLGVALPPGCVLVPAQPYGPPPPGYAYAPQPSPAPYTAPPPAVPSTGYYSPQPSAQGSRQLTAGMSASPTPAAVCGQPPVARSAPAAYNQWPQQLQRPQQPVRSKLIKPELLDR